MTITTEPPNTRDRAVVATVTYGGAAAFLLSAVWYGLALKGLTVASEPSLSRSQTPRERERSYFDWVASTLPQERLYTALAIFGFCCLVGTSSLLLGRLGRSAQSTIAVKAIDAGAGLWVTGNVLQLGGHHAVGLMAAHANPLPTVGSLYFTVDLIDDAFELAAFALLGFGMLLLGGWTVRCAPRAAAWGWGTVILALVMLTTSVSYALDDGDLTNLLLVTGGVVLLPVWLIWSADVTRNGRRASRVP